MNSWALIRKMVVKDERHGTLGHQHDLLKASDLFIRLAGNLRDTEEAMAEWKREPGLAEALGNRALFAEFQGAGLLGGKALLAEQKEKGEGG